MLDYLPDIINPLDGYMGRFLHGPMHRFTVAHGAGTRPVEVELLLRQYGVRVWGRETHSEKEYGFLVRSSQAIWAEYVLCRAGVPLTCQLLDPRNEQYRQRHEPGTMPTPWQEGGVGAHSFVDHVVDWLYKWLG